MEVKIRKGKIKDIPFVHELIKELAEFEKAPDEVEVSIEQMTKWASGKEKIFDFFVAEQEKQIIGLALYYYKYSTWKGKCVFLDDIIVTEKLRNKGIGTLLFDAVVSVAKKEKVKRLEWLVLDWNKNAIEFYKKYNSRFDREWICCQLTYNQLQSFSER